MNRKYYILITLLFIVNIGFGLNNYLIKNSESKINSLVIKSNIGESSNSKYSKILENTKWVRKNNKYSFNKNSIYISQNDFKKFEGFWFINDNNNLVTKYQYLSKEKQNIYKIISITSDKLVLQVIYPRFDTHNFITYKKV